MLREGATEEEISEYLSEARDYIFGEPTEVGTDRAAAAKCLAYFKDEMRREAQQTL